MKDLLLTTLVVGATLVILTILQHYAAFRGNTMPFIHIVALTLVAFVIITLLIDK